MAGQTMLDKVWTPHVVATGPGGRRAAEASNRNFADRQETDVRAHLTSPAMAASAAVTGRLTDVRRLGPARDR